MPSTSLVGLAKTGTSVPPELIVELSSLPASVKKRAMAHLMQAQQPKPMDMAAVQVKLQQETPRAGDRRARRAVCRASAGGARQGRRSRHARPAGTAGGPAQQIDTAADLAKAQLDLAKAREIYGDPKPAPRAGHDRRRAGKDRQSREGQGRRTAHPV
jgi:hypothetical protein